MQRHDDNHRILLQRGDKIFHIAFPVAHTHRLKDVDDLIDKFRKAPPLTLTLIYGRIRYQRERPASVWLSLEEGKQLHIPMWRGNLRCYAPKITTEEGPKSLV